MIAPLEDRLRTELHEEAADVELRAGYVVRTVEQVLTRRRQRRIRALAVAAGVAVIIALGGVVLAGQARDDSSPPVVDEDTVQTLREIEQSRLDAMVDADMPTLEKLHTTAYEVVPPTGYPLLGADVLGAIASGDLDFRAFQPVTEIRVRLYEDAAVVRYQARIDVVSTEYGRIRHSGWIIALYEKRDGRWQVVWEQNTAVGAFPPPKGS